MVLPIVLESSAADAGQGRGATTTGARCPEYPGMLAALSNASCSRNGNASPAQRSKDQNRDVHPPILKLVGDCTWLGYNDFLSQRKPLVAEIVS